MEVITGRHIEGELVELDGRHFVDCILCNCVLEYGGGDVILERTQIRSCQHAFFGRARCTVNYLERMGLIPPESAPWADTPDVIH